jgi:hypothetical protein
VTAQALSFRCRVVHRSAGGLFRQLVTVEAKRLALRRSFGGLTAVAGVASKLGMNRGAKQSWAGCRMRRVTSGAALFIHRDALVMSCEPIFSTFMAGCAERSSRALQEPIVGTTMRKVTG